MARFAQIGLGSRKVVPPSMSGTPTGGEHPEKRVLLDHPQVAPERQFETAGPGVPGDGRDDRLGEQQPGRPRGPVAVVRPAVAAFGAGSP